MKRLAVVFFYCIFLSSCSFLRHRQKDDGYVPQIREHIWTLEQPPAANENPTVANWRQRYEQFRSGSLSGYPFEPYGVAPAQPDPTPIGQMNAAGIMVTENPVRIPPRSTNETEPWGDEGCVWPILNRWSPEWERRYSQWIEQNATPNFLLDNNVEVDCADTPYAFRWIFARINYLPQGAHTNDGSYFGNWSVRPDLAALPMADDWRQDQRFRAGLKYVLEAYVRGGSIPYDTYPIDIRPEAGHLRPGSMAAEHEHVRLVNHIIPDSADPVRQISGTRPRKLQTLSEETLSDMIDNNGPGWGIVNFSWWEYDFNLHRYRCVPDEKMPGFSLDQYQLSEAFVCSQWIQQSFRKQSSKPVDPQEALTNRINNIRELLRVRVDMVNSAWNYYQSHPQDRDPKSIQYDDYSTPHRDERLLQFIEQAQQVAVQYNIPAAVLEQRFAEVTVPTGDPQMPSCDLRSIAYRLQQGALSGVPWDPPARRWGLDVPVPPLGQPALAAAPSAPQSTIAPMANPLQITPTE